MGAPLTRPTFPPGRAVPLVSELVKGRVPLALVAIDFWLAHLCSNPLPATWSRGRGDRPPPVPTQLGDGDVPVFPPHRHLTICETHLEAQGTRQAHWPIPMPSGESGEGRDLWWHNGLLVNHPFSFGFSFSMNATMWTPYRNERPSASSARPSRRRRT